MKDGLLERIKAVGYWRVNIRPKRKFAEPLTFARCKEVVTNARVSIRGWDYPHVNSRQDEYGGESRTAEYYENWCDWWNHREFWRMYKSGQFLSYNALWEDVTEDGTQPQKGALDIRGAIYSITEFVEFSHRLMAQDLYGAGLNLNVSLHNAAGRYLWVGPGRMPFFDSKSTSADKISIERDLYPSDGLEGHRSVAIGMILEIFDYFGWNPARSQIESDQEKFFRRDFR